mgnify:CR=1 FL=1|tara:strand:+ start:123 stop:782 length:660 start_codon:yes stop_codon:yes gene_type:complete
MAFPQDFSSTLTYENIYHLDEIDVFLEGNSINPMFFSVNGLPNQMSFGKHYFNLATLDSTNQDYQLKYNSRILFEFKSKNNVILKSDVTNLKQGNGVGTCFVEVLEDPLTSYAEIEDGEGTLTVAGTLQNKSNRGQLIPEKFKDAINYRCIFPIEIRKNLINADSPKALQSQHKIETALGQFSFAGASISTPSNSKRGTLFDTSGNASSAFVPVRGGGS